MLAQDVHAPIRRTVYSLNFLISLITALVTYFTTPLLLAHGVSEGSIGTVYIGAAIINLIFLFLAPGLFSRFGNYRMFLILLASSTASLALLAFAGNKLWVAALVIFYFSVTAVAYFLLDMVLEGAMPEEGTTGDTRGFLSVVSETAWFVGPVIAGYLLAIGSFELLFLVAAALTIPATVIAMRRLRKLERHVYITPHVLLLFRILRRSRDMRGVFMVQFLFRIFLALMTIYLPLYLLDYIKISYGSFGAILSIAMIAYLIFEWPAGRLADLRFGEKEIMVIGISIIAVTTAMISFASGTSVLVWGAILFGTRIGSAFVDITTESYFFKHMNGENADTVSMFRVLEPAAYIVTALLGSLFLLAMPLVYIFTIFGAIMLLGIPFALSITDTK